jgi:hypothetical protein
VTHACVVHAQVATLRYASFSGVLELAEPAANGVALDSETAQEMLCVLSWYGFTPERGSARVLVGAGWRIQTDYSGEVIDALGKPVE